MIADIAAIFHWGLRDLEAMGLEELSRWHGMAVTRWNKMYGKKED